MPRRSSVPRDLPAVFRGSQALAEGLLTRRQLRGPCVVRMFRDVYRPAWAPQSHELACRGLALVMPREARFTGRSLAVLRGVPLARPEDRVEVLLPEHLRCELRDVAVRRTVRPEKGDSWVKGLPVVSDLRMAFDLAAPWPLPLAVGHLDAAVRGGLLEPGRFARWLSTRHDDGVVHVRRASGLIVPTAESVPESQVRVLLGLAGIEVTVQHTVRRDGRFVARVDLAVRGLRLAIEYDGRHHGLGSQLSLDRQRHNRLMAAGWTVLYVTAELLRDPRRLVAEVRGAMAQAAPLAA